MKSDVGRWILQSSGDKCKGCVGNTLAVVVGMSGGVVTKAHTGILIPLAVRCLSQLFISLDTLSRDVGPVDLSALSLFSHCSEGPRPVVPESLSSSVFYRGSVVFP